MNDNRTQATKDRIIVNRPRRDTGYAVHFSINGDSTFLGEESARELLAGLQKVLSGGRAWNFTCEGCGKHSDEAKGWTMDDDAVWLCKKCRP